MLAKAQTLASRKSIAETLSQTIAARGITAANQQYHERKASQPGEYDFGKDER